MIALRTESPFYGPSACSSAGLRARFLACTKQDRDWQTAEDWRSTTVHHIPLWPERELFSGCTEWGWGLGGLGGLGGWGWGLQRGAASAAEIAAPCGCGREQLAVGPQPISPNLSAPSRAISFLRRKKMFFCFFWGGGCRAALPHLGPAHLESPGPGPESPMVRG